MGLFLGIDGGGTSTACLIGDERTVLGRGAGGPSNVLRVGEVEARNSLRDAISKACSEAGLSPEQVTRTCIGIAGGARPAIAGKVRQMLAETVPGDIEITGDMVIAHHAAFAGMPGVIVIAGTGSIAYGRNLEGKTARAGGWGFAVSDEGSGHWIGRSSIAAALRNADENPGSESSLLRGVMKSWQVETHDDLVAAANSSPMPDFAAVFPVVLAQAGSGDLLSAEVLRWAGVELSALAKVVVARLFVGAQSIPVAMSGGVFRHSAVVRDVFYNELSREYPRAMMRSEIVDPVEGALEMARRAGKGL